MKHLLFLVFISYCSALSLVGNFIPGGLRSTFGRHSANSLNIPKFVAHRGEKFLLPEQTIPAFDVAMLHDPDFVEADLVLTKDGILVCHHDITLRDLTDVAERKEFEHLMTPTITILLEGKNVTIENDWLISNFTLAELKKLKVKQELKGVRPQYFNNLFGIPTFEEYIEAVHHDTWRRMKGGKNATFVMGMIPELKYPNYHNKVVFQEPHYIEKVFMNVLNATGYLSDDCSYNHTKISCSPLVVQCFEVETIKYLSETTNLTLLTLIDANNLKYLTYNGLSELKGKTNYLGLWKELLFTGTEAELIYEGKEYDHQEIQKLGGFIPAKEFVKYANAMGIQVAVYTIYHSAESSRRGCAVKCKDDTKTQELEYYFEIGVQMFFVEGVCESLKIRDTYYARKGERKSTVKLR